MPKPLVSVAMIVYNHEAFLSQAIESIVEQQADFDFEIVICEDYSTDKSREILKSYAEKHSSIRPIYNEKNIGIQKNFYQSLKKCKGKYIAICEGDDYWTDKSKLQKQVDFLEANPEYALCFTGIDVINELNDPYPPNPFSNFTKDTYTIEDYIVPFGGISILIPIMTLVFRNSLPDPMPDLFYKSQSGDISLSLLMLLKGKGKYFNEKTAVYRQHSGGISKSKEFQLKLNQSVYDIYDSFNEYTNNKYHELIKKRLYPLSKTLLMYGSSLIPDKKERRIHIAKMIKGYKKYRPKKILKEIMYYRIALYFPFLLNLYKKLA